MNNQSSIAEDPPTSLDQLTLTELLLRRVSDQQRLQDQLAAAINASSNTLQPNKTAVFRSESLPTVQPPQQQTDMEKLLHNFNLIQQALSAPQPPNHTPIGRTASLNTNISAANANIPVFIAPQPPAFTKQQPLLLQRPPLKATCSSPLNATSGGGLHRTESTKRKLLKSGGSKDGEEPKSKNVATDAVDGNEEDRQFMCRFCNKDFRRPDILSRHLRRHTGEKPFMCGKISK
jgi:uncharacterized Zn-finger protein